MADTIILQAQNNVKSDLNIAWLVFDQSLSHIRHVLRLTASGTTLPDDLGTGQLKKLGDFLFKRRQESGLAVLTLTDSKGKVLLRTLPPFRSGDDQASDPLVARALKGEPVAAAAIISREELQREGGKLAEQALNILGLGPTAKGSGEDGETSGMMLKAAVSVLHLIAKVAPTPSTVLITGESGTGKELIARAIHYHSLRKDRQFIPVDCAVLSENLLESELFGHVKGSFTGAIVTKPGLFQVADGGSLFLDEIGNISLAMQSKLLRVIQEREFTPVGATKLKAERLFVLGALTRNEWNVTRSSKDVGMLRQNFQALMRKYNIRIEDRED